MAYTTEYEWVDEPYTSMESKTKTTQVFNPTTKRYETKTETVMVPVTKTRKVRRAVQVFVPDPPKPFPSRPFGK